MATLTANNTIRNEDLVGGPFSVIESDPGVFTTLLRKLGIKHLQFEEVYDLQSPSALSSLRPKGLVLCFMWRHDKHHPTDFDDPAAKQVWFANQLSDDACASLAILNVVFNCLEADLGEELGHFKEETREMSSVMKGLAITNLHSVRNAQNSLARPADIWASMSAITKSTTEKTKTVSESKPTKRRPKKRGRTAFSNDSRTSNARAATKDKAKKTESTSETDEVTYHFIGYVPAYGKVWELDGFKTGPLEVGELTSTPDPSGGTENWEEVVLPALRLKMEKYGSSADGNIQFSLLALVDDRFEAKSDVFELEKRRVKAIEKRLVEVYGSSWTGKVHPDLFTSSLEVHSAVSHPPFRQDFAHHRLVQDVHILNLPKDRLLEEWEDAVRKCLNAKLATEDEIEEGKRTHTEHVKRTHNYDTFVREFITALHEEGKLDAILKGSKTR